VAQTKADRQAAAKKGAATRERNATRNKSQEAGTKAAATRQGKAAADSGRDAKRAASGAASGEAGGQVGRHARRSRRARQEGLSQPAGTRSFSPAWTLVSVPRTRSRTATMPWSTFVTVLPHRSSTDQIVPRTTAAA
jgi:hypothetical protein